MSSSKVLHVVSFNVPYPPDYGGVIDIYYKLKALQEAGIKVILHSFSYGRDEEGVLKEICHEVHYYRRRQGIYYVRQKLPYIVVTRQDPKLRERLLMDNHPVLFEGLHSTFYLGACRMAGKKVYVRTHNIEHNYYNMLSRSERILFRKIYLRSEARKLKKYEAVLKEADQLFSISKTDTAHFNTYYGNSTFVSAFHQHNEITSKPGQGDYILFHGNLSVPENEKALIYLVKNVFERITYHVKIAGKSPSRHVERICSKYAHVELIADPDDEQMRSLVREAHINLLYTYQPTGLKLKLLHSLHGGRYCMANPLMLSGSGLDELCEVYRSTEGAVKMIDEIMKKPFEPEEILKRSGVLENYNNSRNIQKMIEQL